MKSLYGFLAVLGLALVIAGLAVRPPAPAPADAPEAAFSAERAMADVRRMSRAPHPTGSAENRHVRDYLVRRLEDLGLEVRIQRAAVLRAREPGWALGANVENIVATLPGEDRDAPVVLLMSHYDSAVGSPGAADDAAGVASSLEAVRALLAEDAPRRRDLVVLITDAEEQGLLGAQAFFEEHPLRDRIGAIVNLETRGAAGRAFMFQTGPDNGDMMGLYARDVTQPSTTSIAAFLYSILPNDTDFTHAVEAGMAGFNIAFIGEPFHYHSVTSTPETLDQGSLQHMGSQALDLTRALVGAEVLPEHAPDAVFSDVFGLFTLAYPAWGGWLILLASGGLIALLAARPRDGGPIPWKALLIGAGAGLGAAILAALLSRLVLIGTGVVDDFVENRPLLGRLPELEAALFLSALGAALLAGRLAARGWRGGADRSPEALALGVLALGWLLSLVLQVVAPGAALLTAWPTLIGAAAVGLAPRFGRIGPWASAALVVLGLAFVLTLIHGIFLGVGWSLPEAVGALGLVALLAAAPLWTAGTASRRAMLLGGLCLALAAGLTLWLRFAPDATPERPRFTQVLYVADPAGGEARLVAPLSGLDAWTRRVLESGGGAVTAGEEPALWLPRAHVAPAAPVSAAFAPAEVSRLPDGRVQAVVRPPAGARELRLTLESAVALDQVRVDDREVRPAPAGEPVRVRWADPGEALTITLADPGDAPVRLRWAAFVDGWPPDAPALPPRAADEAPWGSSDSLVVIGEAALRPPG